MVTLSESISDWQCMKTWMKDSVDRSTCMWVKRVAESVTVHAKQFQGRKNLRLLGGWFSHVNAQIGDRVEIIWTSPTDFTIRKL